MNPLDALDPNITDEKLAEFYGDSFMDLVRDNYPISAVRNDDKIWAHQWLTDLMLQIEECKCEDKMWCDCLGDWDRIPTKLSDLLAEVKQLREENDDSLNQIAQMATIITSIRDWLDDAPAILGKDLEDILGWVEKI